MSIESDPSIDRCVRLFQLDGVAPLHKEKATIVPCKDLDIVFLYGGFDDMDEMDSNVYLLNLKTKTWEVDDKHEKIFREGHSATYIGNGNIIVFGGIPAEDDLPIVDPSRPGSSGIPLGFRPDSLMMIYNIHDRKWIGPPPFALNHAPKSRSRHACCLSPDGTKLYISGGISNRTPMNDLYYYDLVLGKWSNPIRFVYRFDHYITIHDDKLYSFGGIDKDMNHFKTSITYFSLTNGTIGVISNIREVKETLRTISPSNATYMSQQCERIYRSSEINPSITLDIRLPLWNSHFGLFDISIVDIDEFETQNLLSMHVFVDYFRKTKKINLTKYAWNEAFVNKSNLYILGVKKFRGERNPDNIRRSRRGRESFGEDYDDDLEEDYEEESVDNGHAIAEDDSSIDEESAEIHISEDGEAVDVSPKLTRLLEINLADLGITNNQESLHPKGTLTNDLAKLFLDEKFTDFEIFTLTDAGKKIGLDIDNIDVSSIIPDGTFKAIKVHKSILIARWPHFNRMISAGMNETLMNRMLIPEPYEIVRGMIYFLYTERLDESKILHNPYNVLDYSSLLFVSKFYTLPNLSSLAMKRLFSSFENLRETLEASNQSKEVEDESINVCISLWKRLYLADEPLVLIKVLNLIKKRWSTIIRSKTFAELSKEEIVSLCQGVTDDIEVKYLQYELDEVSDNRFEDTFGNHELATNVPSRNTNSPFLLNSRKGGRENIDDRF